ncbi:MAG: polymer-forming cytoskeletal protein, partial [Eubacteriales bacterium]
MIYLLISIMLFLFMAFLPIGFSLFSLRKRKSEELIIPNLQVDAPEYFSQLYRDVFDSKWRNRKEGNVVELGFKQSEQIIEADKTNEYPMECNSVVYAEKKDFRPPEGIIFTKEIHTDQNAYLHGIKSIIGIYSKKDILLGNGLDVVRWVDAEGTVTAENNVNLGLVTSSDTKIEIGAECEFSKLYAPNIFINCDENFVSQMDEDILRNFDPYGANEIIRNIKYADHEEADENNVIKKTIISKHNIDVVDGIKVEGDIRSNKGVRLGENAVVYGNVFAEG